MLLLLLALWTPLSAAPAPPTSLRIAVAQIGIVSRADDNLQKILEFIDKAADENCRVVVFPEGALRGLKAPEDPDTTAALNSVSQAAARRQIYVMLGVFSLPENARRGFNWMVVFDSDGKEIFRYTKLYDRHDSPLPRVFYIDGIPCSAIICADRWLRGVEDLPIMDGAQVSFELSDNFESEWVPQLGWYWYIARALRNSVYVVFANSATAPEQNDRHGHSAVIDPRGQLAAAIQDAREQLITTNLDLSLATRAEAEQRLNDPVLRDFWKMGAQVRGGEAVTTPAWKPYASPEIELTVAAAQIRPSPDSDSNAKQMEKRIREAKSRGAELVAFPEIAIDAEKDLRRIQKAARKHRLYVVFATAGMEGERRNSAYAIGPDGNVLTRYDQLASCPSQMWFLIKGVPAVVTIGKDALSNEIAEMAALAGAQLLLNLSDGTAGIGQVAVQATFASFRTLTVFANPAGAGGSSIWDDLQADAEIRAAVSHSSLAGKNRMPAPAVYASFAANCVAKAGTEEKIIYARARVNGQNPYHPETMNPQMKAWYAYGAQLIRGCGKPNSGLSGLNGLSGRSGQTQRVHFVHAVH